VLKNKQQIQLPSKLMCIVAMKQYVNVGLEELRLDHYRRVGLFSNSDSTPAPVLVNGVGGAHKRTANRSAGIPNGLKPNSSAKEKTTSIGVKVRKQQNN